MSEFLSDIQDAGNSTVGYWKETWIHNACENRGFIHKGLKAGRVTDFGNHPRIARGPAYLCASGPSLDSTPWDLLREAQAKGAGVFSATSNIKSLLANGVNPTYTIIVDSNHSIGWHIREVADLTPGIELLACPLVDPQALKLWKGPISIFKPLQHGDTFIQDILPKMYSTRHDIDETHRVYVEWLNVALLNAGCVTNAMLLAASYLGYDPIFMLGNDLGYPHGKHRCATYTRIPGDGFQAEPPSPIRAREPLRTASNGVRTVSEYLHYKLNLFISWRLNPCKLYNCAPAGILHPDEIPQVSPLDAITQWESLDEGYPIAPGSAEWALHVQNIMLRMGMKMEPIKGGYQISTLSTPPQVIQSVPPQVILTNSPPLSQPSGGMV